MNKFKSIFIVVIVLFGSVSLIQAETLDQILDRSFSQEFQKQAGECPTVRFSDNVLFDVGGRKVKFDTSCFVDIEAIDVNQYQIVDVRQESEYQKGHIKNAINIPLHQIANKRF